MNVADFDVKKSALRFFDTLNGYYHLADGATEAQKKPTIDNAARLTRDARNK